MIRFEGSGKYGVGVWRDTELLAMIHADDWNTFRLSSVLIFLTADELEQIAAKLRELNGEPNTRALDERVKELRDKLREKRVSVVAPYVGVPDLSETQIHNFEAVPWGDITRTINELFPAELKEKLKESEDG